jgi:hypothetical protein
MGSWVRELVAYTDWAIPALEQSCTSLYFYDVVLRSLKPIFFCHAPLLATVTIQNEGATLLRVVNSLLGVTGCSRKII